MKSKFLGHSANDLFWFILPLVLPSLLVQYNLTYSQAGGILTSYLTVTAIGSFIIGKLSDRYSQKYILAAGLIFASLGFIVSGFAPTLTVFIIVISLTAIGVSTFHPVMYAVIDENYPDNKGKVMSWYETFGSGAILIMFLINGYLLERIGIRGVLIITAIPALIMGLYYLFSRSIPERKPHHETGGKNKEAATSRDLIRFVLFLVSVILRVFSVAAVLNFLPTILVNFLGFSKSTASYGTAFFFAGGIAGSLMAGRFSELFHPMKVLIAGTAFIVPGILALTMNLPGWVFLLVIAVFGFFGSGCIISQNLLMTTLGKHLGKGEVFGILMGVLTMTAAFSPALFGLLIDRMGFHFAMILFTFPLLFSVIILLFVMRDKAVFVKFVN